LGYHKVVLRVAIGNDASERVAEKLGFSREGVLREELLIRGRWTDHTLYSMLDREHQTESPLLTGGKDPGGVSEEGGNGREDAH
jgi:ribosomal-protein-serine acetyltransferase